MILGTRIQASAATTSNYTSSRMGSGEFGAVLASMTTQEPVQNQLADELVAMPKMLAELLQMTTLEELNEFLQENGFEQGDLLEVIGGHLILQNEEMIAWFDAVIPGFATFVRGEEMPAVDMRDLLVLFEEMSEQLLLKAEQNGLPENLSKDQIMMLFTAMQLTAIEVPKTDLTVKQEQQLHTLQEVLKSMGNVLNEGSQKNEQSKMPVPLFQQIKSVVNGQQESQFAAKQANESIGQTSFSIMGNTGVESSKVEGETENTRAEQLMRELQGILKRANFGQTGGTNRISIKLYPEHLGQLRIELLQTNGVLTARILASNALGKDMLESQLHQLRQAFLQQNIQVERIDISQMMTETPYDDRNHAFNQHFKKQQEQTQGQENEDEDEEILSFSEYMIELEG